MVATHSFAVLISFPSVNILMQYVVCGKHALLSVAEYYSTLDVCCVMRLH